MCCFMRINVFIMLLAASCYRRRHRNNVVMSLREVPGGSPENFTAIGLTSTSVQLKWDAPAKKLRHGDIVLYEVFYYRADNPQEDFAVNATDTSVMVEGLDVDADYIFRLRAYTVKGSGPWTRRLPFKTFANR